MERNGVEWTEVERVDGGKAMVMPIDNKGLERVDRDASLVIDWL